MKNVFLAINGESIEEVIANLKHLADSEELRIALECYGSGDSMFDEKRRVH